MTESQRRSEGKPLVTVGIPTWNRPEGLARTLSCIMGQTYQNLEIIISDNASSDTGVERIARSAELADQRVCYIRQDTNNGPVANFEFLMRTARGSFFMLAADDDQWDGNFVERCASILYQHPDVVLCQMEVQYQTAEGLYPFFQQGAPFYERTSRSIHGRILHLIQHNYDNLIYGLFRREALFHRSLPITRWFGRTLNEIPLLVIAASKGDIVVLPEIGMHKFARREVCDQARWEHAGGILPNFPGWLAYFQALVPTHRYHSAVSREIRTAVWALDLTRSEKIRLAVSSFLKISKHDLQLALRFKPQRTRQF